MSTEISIKCLKNNRLVELLIKKYFNGIDANNFKIIDNKITFKLNYRIGHEKIHEKLTKCEGDYEIINIKYSNLTDEEEKELQSLSSKKRKLSEQ